MRSRQAITVLIALGVVSFASVRWGLQADDNPAVAPAGSKPPAHFERAPDESAPAVSVADSLQRPITLPFAQPTSLTDVTKHLGRVLNAPVALDLAALKRLDITPAETVQLELKNVRLKTALRLLLDQVRMTYRVEPEDNLLILTDARGSDEPLDRVFSELKSLHRDVHELQDSLDDLRSDLGLDEEGGVKMRKPTIIEELPVAPETKPAAPETKPGNRPRS